MAPQAGLAAACAASSRYAPDSLVGTSWVPLGPVSTAIAEIDAGAGEERPRR